MSIIESKLRGHSKDVLVGLVVERFHRVDRLIGLRQKITGEIQRRTHE